MFKARVGKNLGSSIHNMGCPAASNPRQTFLVDAETAEMARRKWDDEQQVAMRRLPRTIICKCCKEAP